MNKEKPFFKKRKKILLRFLLSIAIFVVLVIMFISPITKYLVEKYDVEYIGREVTMDWAYVNPFTGHVQFYNLKVYEEKGNSIFFAASGIGVNFTMYKLVSKTYEISSFNLDNPKAIISRTDNVFNFNDLILKFAEATPKKEKEPLHFNILNIAINNGEFYYKETDTPINYSFLEFNFTSDGKYWDSDSFNGKLSLIPGEGTGSIKADFFVNLKTSNYQVSALLDKFNLNIPKQYLKDLADYGNISGNVDADVTVKGNFKNKQKIDGKGYVSLNDFHLGKDPSEDYISFKKAKFVFKKIAPVQKKFFIKSVRIDEPMFKYEKYDYLDNLQNMIGKDGANVKAIKQDPEKFNLLVTAGDYIQTIFKNFFTSDYKVNSLSIVDANLTFNDFSANDKFSVSLNPFNIRAKDLDSKKERVNINLTSGIKPYGAMSVGFSINPKSTDDFNIKYRLQKIPVPLFNPYLITYTSFPADRGEIELSGNWQVHNNIVNSRNHVIIIDPRVSKKIKKKDGRWIPLQFIMSIVRDRGNVIDYEIPINGNLKDPNFRFQDPIIDALTNIFVKPATTPYRYEVKNTEKEIEKTLSLKWKIRQTKLTNNQEKFLSKISKFLEENPEANIEIHPMTFTDKEKENILFFEAKKKYYLSVNKTSQKDMTEHDSLAIEKISSKDSSFVAYLDKNVSGNLLFTVQEKCYRLVGAKVVNTEFEKMLGIRNKVFSDYFKNEGTNNQIKIFSNKNTIPFTGFSFFKINYKGDIPEALLEAFQKLNEFNDNAPRARYEKFRNRNR